MLISELSHVIHFIVNDSVHLLLVLDLGDFGVGEFRSRRLGGDDVLFGGHDAVLFND